MQIIPHGAGLAPDVTIHDGLVYLALPLTNSLHLNVYTTDGALVRTRAIEHGSYPRFGSGWMAFKQSTGGGANHPAALNVSTGEVVSYQEGRIDGDPGVIISGNNIVWQTLVGSGDNRKYAVTACPLAGGQTRSLGFVGAPDGLEAIVAGRVWCRKDIRDIAPHVGGYVQRAGPFRIGQFGFGLGVRRDGWSVTRHLLGWTLTKDPRIATDGTMYAITCWGTDVPLVLATDGDLKALPLVPIDTPPPDPPIVLPPEEPVPMTGITDAQFATLERIRAKYPVHVDERDIGAILNEVAWIHRSEGVGMQAKPGGTAAVQPRTGTRIWNGMRFTVNGQHTGQDVLEGATVGRAGPVRGTIGPADPASFVAPVQPEGAPVEQPPAPPAPPDLSWVRNAIDELKREDKELKDAIAELRARPVDTLPTQTEVGGRFLPHSHAIKAPK